MRTEQIEGKGIFSLYICYNVVYHSYMKIKLNYNSPVPLYHQIAETIKYQIATGQIQPGDRLPSIREAAASWHVNMHTVRHAFRELEGENFLEIRGPKGARVSGSAIHEKVPDQKNELDIFIRQILSEGQAKHGLSRDDIIRMLANYRQNRSGIPENVYVVECSETQCLDHTKEIKARWDVGARPWCLSRPDEPPSGTIIATYFHYNEIRERWPHRISDIRFVSIHPDPHLLSDLRMLDPKTWDCTLIVCEFDEQMANNVATDLFLLLKDESYCIKPCVVSRANAKLKEGCPKKSLLLFPPRIWGALTTEERNTSRVKKVTYRFTDEAIESLGDFLGWSRQRTSR